MRFPLLVLVGLSLLAVPADAHGTFEASELELHVHDDEGSDVIESYGGFDIQDLFIGFAHDPNVGAGASGDGFYVRLELYGLMANSPPVPGQEWSVSVTMQTPAGPLTRTLSTTDGTTFTSDYDALLFEIDDAERTTHIQRAFIAYASAGLAPGSTIGPFLVESRVDGDLRDASPGGIPVPGGNGAAEYPDPTQIDGEGALLETVTLLGPEIYVEVSAVSRQPGAFYVTVASALETGEQHVFVTPVEAPGWTYNLTGITTASLPANGSFAFTLEVDAGTATDPLRLEVQTDTGGRADLWVLLDGTLTGPDNLTVASAPEVPRESPGFGWAAPLLLVAVALVRRRAV
ncbi:MAG: hypothetical protein ACYC2H_03710 [Thermoplasmatota archaeon]